MSAVGTASYAGKVLVGIIGGSGLYHLDNLTPVDKVDIDTPWGKPSSAITIALAPSGTYIAFLARHGPGHTISPSAVPSRANISALKSLGVRLIVAFSAVGSLREEIRPGDFVLPTQIIDRTKGVRPVSFFDEETKVVAHAAFGDPMSLKLVRFLEEKVKEALAKEKGENGDARDVRLHADRCIVCMEGPQFSTRAESKMYRAWGGDIINMSVLPEAKLAREAELSYALIATATDYDSWRENSEPVTASEVFKTLKLNADTSRRVTEHIVADLHTAAESGDIVSEEVGSMRFSIMPRSEGVREEDKKKLTFVLPEYFS